MKTVILDAHITDHNDIDWDPICKLAPTVIHQHSPHNEVCSQIGNATIAVSNSIHYDSTLLAALPSLKCISLISTGTDKVDLAYTERNNIAVYNCPAYSTESTAEHAWALIFAIMRRIESHAQMVREGYWCAENTFSCWHYPQQQLAGKTIGIIGYGAIGAKVAAIAQAFSMSVIMYSSRRARVTDAGFRWMPLSEILQQSDIVSLHCPLTVDTRYMIGTEELRAMKKSACLINTARGPLVDAQALRHALMRGVIAAAAVDVLEDEPPRASEQLCALDNCIVTPHCAWTSIEARQRLVAHCAENITAFLVQQQ